MKKFFVLLSIIAILACSVILSGCGGSKCNGSHTYELLSSTATCEDNGVSTYKCSVCGETKTESVGAYGHDNKTTFNKCDRCGKTFTDVSQLSSEQQKALALILWEIPPALYERDQVETLGKLLQLAQKDIEDCEKEVAAAEANKKNVPFIKVVGASGRYEYVQDEAALYRAQQRIDAANTALEKARNDYKEYYAAFALADICLAYKLVIDKLNTGATNNKDLVMQLVVAELEYSRYVGQSSGNTIKDGIINKIKEVCGIDISVFEGALLE